jgi:hypothetical protein
MVYHILIQIRESQCMYVCQTGSPVQATYVSMYYCCLSFVLKFKTYIIIKLYLFCKQ